MTRLLFFGLFLSAAALTTLPSLANAQTLVAPSFLSGDSFTMGVTDIISAGDPGEEPCGVTPRIPIIVFDPVWMRLHDGESIVSVHDG